jgi:hypothetical protein
VRVEDVAELPALEGSIFLCTPDLLAPSLARWPDRPDTLASRMVLFDLVRTYALQWAEQYSLAAVIETRHYLNWKRHQDAETPAALYGSKAAARLFGATWPPGPPFEGEHYALLSHPELRKLPALLAAYLHAYAPLLPD